MMAKRKGLPNKVADSTARTELPDSAVEDAIRQRAYELYEERGRADGRPDDDWLRAKAEVLARVGGNRSQGGA